LSGGVNLCLLTNGIDYRLFHLTWDKAGMESNVILSFNLLDEDINSVADKLDLLSKDSFKKGHIDKYIAEATSLGDKNLAQAMLSDRVLNAIRLELKNLTGHNIKNEAIEKSIGTLFGAELYEIARACIRRQARKEKKTAPCAPPEIGGNVAESLQESAIEVKTAGDANSAQQ